MTLRSTGDRDLAVDRALGLRHLVREIGADAVRQVDKLTPAQNVEIAARLQRYARRVEQLEHQVAEFDAGRAAS